MNIATGETTESTVEELKNCRENEEELYVKQLERMQFTKSL